MNTPPRQRCAGPEAARPAIKHWPEADRPRERLVAHGAKALSEAELLALLLRTGAGGVSALDLGRATLRSVEEAGGWERASVASLRRVKGMGMAKSAAVVAALELGRRAAGFEAERPRLQGSRQAWEWVRGALEGRLQEAVLVVALDARHRALGTRIVTVGTLTQSLVHPREVFRPALELGAAAVLVAHNHPSGDCAPSGEDDQATQRLRAAADVLGVHLVDHLVVGRGAYFSYADHGWTHQSPWEKKP